MNSYNLRFGLVPNCVNQRTTFRYRRWPMRIRAWQKLVADLDAKEQRYTVFAARRRLTWLYQRLAYELGHWAPSRKSSRPKPAATAPQPRRKATKALAGISSLDAALAGTGIEQGYVIGGPSRIRE